MLRTLAFVVGLLSLGVVGVASLGAQEPTLAPPEEQEAPPLLLPSQPARQERGLEEVLPAPVSLGAEVARPESTAPLPRRHHPWGRFEAGAWRRVSILSESFDQRGITLGRSTTIRTERLEAVGPRTYQLHVESVVGLGGKQLPAAEQRLTLSLMTDRLTLPHAVVETEKKSLALDGESVPCTVWECTTPTDQGERIEKLFYSARRSPHLLRREQSEVVQGLPGRQSVSSIVRVGLPTLLQDALVPVAHRQTTTQFPGGGERMGVEVLSDTVPGGLLQSSEVEHNASGERIRWSMTYLLDSGLSGSVPTLPARRPERGQPGADPATPAAEPEEPEPVEEIRPRRLLRLLRRAELVLPTEADAQELGEPSS